MVIYYDFPNATEDELERWVFTQERPSINADRVRQFARRHNLQYASFLDYVRVWFTDEQRDLALRARDRYHAVAGGHTA